jgi:hypothetical protein
VNQRIPTQNNLKPLKMKKEPEQLELFAEVPSVHLSEQVCREIATFTCNSYELPSCEQVIGELISRYSGWSVHSTLNVLSEYITGASTALNPFPSSSVQVGSWLDDQIALSSDWHAVQTDINDVCQVVSSAQTLTERVCNERPWQQKQRASTERSDAA